MKYAQVLGPLATIEALHTRVPAGFYRHYLSMQYLHTDNTVAGREIVPVRVVTTDAGTFPAVAIEDQQNAPDAKALAVRNVTIPPLGWIGARVGALAAGTRIQLRVLWIEMPVGESFASIT